MRYQLRCTAAIGLLGVSCLAMAGGTSAGGRVAPVAAEGSPGTVELAPAPITEQQAVARVLATDPRFADLADYETLRRLTARDFKPYILDTSHYRVLPGAAADLALFGFRSRTPASWLISVVLVSGCVEGPARADPPADDPCAWRHSWTYRVTPDGSVSLLFDEGDPGAAGPTPNAEIPPFATSDWTLAAIGTARMRQVTPWIRFGADGTVTGFGGCNAFAGPYTVSGASISIGPLVVSDRTCDEGVAEIETVLLEVLQAAPEWWMSDGLLKVGTQDLVSPLANRVLTFQPAIVDA